MPPAILKCTLCPKECRLGPSQRGDCRVRVNLDGKLIIYYEYTYETSRLAKQAGIKNILVTAGFINEKPLRKLCTVSDAANVDIKSFDESFYRGVCAGRLQPVLDCCEIMRQEGVLVEITNLIVPTLNDSLDTIRRMCGWIAKELGPDQPLHFSRFHPEHKLTHLAPTPVETLVKARDSARAEGLRYVYIGNVPGLEGVETTYCPNCKKAVIERDIFAVTRMDLTDGKCRFCGTKIAGVWKT